MSSPTEIFFNDSHIAEEIVPYLGGLSAKFINAANDAAQNRYGKTALRDPSFIELTPLALGGEVSMIARMWHQTEGSKPAVVQHHDTSLTMSIDGEHAYLATETGMAYPLTSREALLMQRLAMHTLIHSGAEEV